MESSLLGTEAPESWLSSRLDCALEGEREVRVPARRVIASIRPEPLKIVKTCGAVETDPLLVLILLVIATV